MTKTSNPAAALKKCAFVALGILALAACDLPRGVGLTSQIVKEETAETPSFQVVRVSRAELAAVQKWPTNGTNAHYSWPKGGRGPDSQVIRTGDKVDLVIWDNQDNSLLTSVEVKTVTMPGLTVSPSGTIFVPYLDEVVVSGQTPAKARNQIQNALNSIIPSAQVQLEMTAGQKNSVNLVSGVAKPGSFPLPDRNYRILTLIAQGGGIAPSLRNPLVQLQRGDRTYNIRADNLFRHSSHNITLRGGDSVMVLEDQRYFTAFGATGSEQLIRFDQEKITALEALSIIGGLSDTRANPKGVLVLRDYNQKALRSDDSGPNNQQVIFAFDVTSADGLFAARKFEIQPQDTVVASESTVTSVRTILGLVGSVFGAVDSANSVGN
ncbi:polysaccharide export protein [Rhodobacteraceae bacterium KMM 6894]|nr:polysaccharide export protein [Rhodobacteraceae bacterium KMM 6894]